MTERLVRSYRNIYQAHSELIMSSQGIRSQILYRSIDIQHVYRHAKFEFSSFSSLANMKGDGAHQQSNSILLVKIKLKQDRNKWSGNWS